MRVVRVDTTGPAITIHSPQNTTTNDSTPLLNATFGEVVNATWYSNGTAATSPYYGGANLTLNLTPLPDGPQNVTVYANDSLGNVNYSTVYFTVDALPPQIDITNPANGTVVGVFNNTINGTASDVVSAINSVNITGNVTGAEVDVAGGRFVHDIAYLNGSNTIVVNATDGVGHVGSSNITITVIKELHFEVNTTESGGAFMWDANSGYLDFRLNLSTGSEHVNGTMNVTGHSLPSEVGSSTMDVNAGSLEWHLGKFLEINASGNLSWAELCFHYADAELDHARLTEGSLSLYFDNGSTWKELNDGLDWVSSTGINTTDEGNYSGYVRANVSRFGTFSLVGSYWADLLIGNITFSSSSPTEGDAVTLNVSVNNTNGTDADNFTVEFLVDGASRANNTMSLKNNSANITAFTWTAVAGSHNLTFVVDSTGGVRELNETNNNATSGMTVSSRPSTPSSGGGGGSPAEDVAATAAVEGGKASATLTKISKDKTGTITIPGTAEMPLEEIAITVKSTVLNMKLVVYEIAEKPSDITADITGAKVHSYIRIDEANIKAADIDSVAIKFKVPSSWLSENGIDKSKVVLNRYADGKWMALETAEELDDSKYVHYSAASPGLSVFAISAKFKPEPVLISEAPVTETEAPIETAAPEEEPERTPIEIPEPQKPEKKFLGICGPSALLLLAMLPPLLRRARERRKIPQDLNA